LSGPERILLRRPLALGDVVWATPLLRALKAARPWAELHLATACPEILAHDPHLAGLNDLTPDQADRVVDLFYELTPERHVRDGYAASAGLDKVEGDPRIYLTPEETAQAGERLAPLGSGPGPLVVLHPGVAWPEKTWAWFNWDRLARYLVAGLGARLAVVGRKADFRLTPWPGLLDLKDRLTLRELAAVIGQADLFVGLDSGPLHLAAALGVPRVGIYGCVDPAKWATDQGVFVPVRVDLPCSGCLHRLPPPVFKARCQDGGLRCVRELSLEMALGGVRQALARSDRAWPWREPAQGWAESLAGLNPPGSGRFRPFEAATGRVSLRLGGGPALHSGRDPAAEGRALADQVRPEEEVVLLGLGLGYHLAALLAQPGRTGRVAVVEALPELFQWALALGPAGPAALDERVHFLVGLEAGETAGRLQALELDRPRPLALRSVTRLELNYYRVLEGFLAGG
jgi:ADP-heptose:LPS heptosyltransferase